MDYRLKRINSEVKSYDKHLFAVKLPNGQIQVHRRMDSLEMFGFGIGGDNSPTFVLAVTHDFTAGGFSVDLGLEPLMERIREMDSWNKESLYRDLCARRDRQEEDRKRMRQNENRAIASELQRDFAKATNDINTSTLGKTDRRSVKNGYC